mmetsp:Transcript_65879/g.157191  ORF Transcript_65879/g.157191 Transcript_65879/m.157191 type:complete len:130 (+) Transcript_65879:1216-1605(+)
MAKTGAKSLKNKLLKLNRKNTISAEQFSVYKNTQSFTKLHAIRYGFHRRSDLKKEKIKKIIGNANPFLVNINSSDPLIISIKGITKFFIGEIIEISKEIMHKKNDTVEWIQNPLEPFHIRESLEDYHLF